MKKVVIIPSAGILCLALLVILLTRLGKNEREAKPVGEEISHSPASAVLKEPKGEGKSEEEEKEEEKQTDLKEKEVGKEKTKEELLALDRDPFLFYPEKRVPGDVQEETIRPEEIGLNGIIYDPENPRVIIKDQIVGEGDEVDGKRIEKIEPDKIILIDIQRHMKLICPLEEEKR